MDVLLFLACRCVFSRIEHYLNEVDYLNCLLFAVCMVLVGLPIMFVNICVIYRVLNAGPNVWE